LSGNVAAIWLMSGVTPTPQGYTNANAVITHVGDFNGDGMSDLVWRNTDGSTSIWLMNHLQMTSSAVVETDPRWVVTDVANFNGTADGTRKSDLLLRKAGYNTTRIKLMNGLVATTTQDINADPTLAVNAVGDYDGDTPAPGRSDLVSRSNSGTTSMWIIGPSGVAASSTGTLYTDPALTVQPISAIAPPVGPVGAVSGEPTTCSGNPCMSFISGSPGGTCGGPALTGAAIYREFEPVDAAGQLDSTGYVRWIGQVRHMDMNEVANAVTWNAGGTATPPYFTGFVTAQSGGSYLDQKGETNTFLYNAFQAEGNGFGSWINTATPGFQKLQVTDGGPNSVLTWNYSPRPTVFHYPTSVFVVQADVRVPRADISDQNSPDYPSGQLSLEFQLHDRTIPTSTSLPAAGYIDFVAKIFDTRARGTSHSNSVQELSWRAPTQDAVLYVPLRKSAGSPPLPLPTFGHESPASPFEMANGTTQTGATFGAPTTTGTSGPTRMYRFEVSQSELNAAIVALNLAGGHFSLNPADYELVEVSILHEVFVCNGTDCAHDVTMGTSVQNPYVMEFY
jgi:hypothetical protein